MRGASVVIGFVLAIGPLALAGQAVSQADLMRCGPRSSQACLTMAASTWSDLSDERGGGGQRSTAWRARFRGDSTVAGVGQRVVGRRVPPARVLVLVDVSGSMKSDFRFVYTLSALRFFLRQLDSLPGGTVRVGVSAFGSRDVRRGVEQSQFVTPAAARLEVDALRSPDRENTGLFSAIEAGVTRLDREISGLGDDARGYLVVITDGNNEVRPGDDRDLLDGPAGLAVAASAVSESRSVVTILGIGNLNRPALAQLAGERGRVAMVSDAQFKLGQQLTGVRDLLASTWEVAFPLEQGRADLGRGFSVLRARLGVGAVPPAAWVPPLVALPAFVGEVPAGLIPSPSSGTRVEWWWIGAPMLLVMVGVLWLVLPPRLWPVAVEVAPAVAKRNADPRQLLTGVSEVSARKPTEITATRAKLR